MNTFDAKLFGAVSYAVSTDESRYYLNGVYLVGGMVVATDGHMMAIAHDPNAKIDEPGIFPVTSQFRAGALSSKARIVRIEGGIMDALNEYGESLFTERSPPIDGTFPDFRRLVPSGDLVRATAPFSSVIMDKVVKIATAIRPVGVSVPITTWAAPDKGGETDATPHIVKYDDPRIFLVIMSTRHDDAHIIPGWFTEPAKIAAE